MRVICQSMPRGTNAIIDGASVANLTAAHSLLELIVCLPILSISQGNFQRHGGNLRMTQTQRGMNVLLLKSLPFRQSPAAFSQITRAHLIARGGVKQKPLEIPENCIWRAYAHTHTHAHTHHATTLPRAFQQGLVSRWQSCWG